jgi:hypothetical protein
MLDLLSGQRENLHVQCLGGRLIRMIERAWGPAGQL